MRWGTAIFYILLSGIFIPAYKANAVAIKSTDTLNNNYNIHHRVIIYNDLSSYKNTKYNGKKRNNAVLNRQFLSFDRLDGIKEKSENLPDLKDTKLTQFPISGSNINTSYEYISKARAELFLENEHNSNYEEIQVGSFLDSFKSDPQLQTLYFNSKDLIFSYKKKISDALQIGFDMEVNDYKNFEGSWVEKQEDKENMERRLGSKNGQNFKQESQFLFNFIVDSYNTILYILLAIFATIYISFRYFLNKYI